MKNVGSKLLIALLGLFIMTAGATAQTLGTSTEYASAPQDMTAGETTGETTKDRSILYVDRFVSMAAGGVLSALAADLLLDASGPYTIILGTMGMVVGDWYYKEGFWPFDKQEQAPAEMEDPSSPFSDLLSQADPARLW